MKLSNNGWVVLLGNEGYKGMIHHLDSTGHGEDLLHKLKNGRTQDIPLGLGPGAKGKYEACGMDFGIFDFK